MATRVYQIPVGQTFDADDKLRHVERISRLMDSEFQIPGTNFRFGLDPIVGLVPGLGNLASSGVSIALLLTMMRHGASGHVVVRMILNILIDSTLGAIPIVGNLFDFAFKSNDMNVELLRRHYYEGKYQGSGRGLVAAVGLGLFAFLGLAAWGFWVLLMHLLHFIGL